MPSPLAPGFTSFPVDWTYIMARYLNASSMFVGVVYAIVYTIAR